MPVFYCQYRCDPPRTGGEWAYHHTANYLASQSDVDLQELDDSDVSALRIPSINLGIQLRFLKRFWGLSADTIIVQASENYMQLCLANWLLKLRPRRARILMLVHSDPYLGGMNWKGRLIDGVCFRMHVCSADRLISNSIDMYQRLVRLGVNKKRIVVITPPAQEFSSPRRVVDSMEMVQIICPANIYAKKGQEVLIEAIRRIDDSRVTAVFPGLIKDPDYYSRLISKVKRYGLDQRISFLGYLHGQEMAEAYAQSSICVIPSLHEPYGMVVQEAMLFGLPVIASRVGGLTEQINEGVDGLLVTPGSPDALATAIERVAYDADMRERLVKNAKEKTKTFPTWEKALQRTHAVIREVADGN